MKFEISQKDKNLLVFLSMFIIIVCISYWGIYPTVTSIGEIESNIEDEEDEQTANVMKITQLPLFETDNQKLEEKIKEAKSGYYEMMTNDEIDKYFTELVMNYNLLSYDLEIGDSTVTNVDPYTYSQKAEDEAKAQAQANIVLPGSLTTTSEDEELEEIDEAEASLESGSTEESSDEDVAASVGIYTVTVDMRLGGEEEDLLRFIDDMSTSSQKLRVCSYSWTGERNVVYDDDGNYSVNLNRSLNISIEIYMCEEWSNNGE
jgi:hypothetical protein